MFSNQLDMTPGLYRQRCFHEASFRDLKSDGFNWQTARVWLPDHVGRLLVLALATRWSPTQGTIVLHLFPLTRRQQRLSVSRLGLDYLWKRFHALSSQALVFQTIFP